jgi:hypothetical protein
MSEMATVTLVTLPVEIVYRILDHMDQLTILLSIRNVCTRLNAITDTYHRYQVKFSCIFKQFFLTLHTRTGP